MYVQCSSRREAHQVRAALDGQAIYDGCCFLTVDLVPLIYTNITTPDAHELAPNYFYDDTPYVAPSAALTVAERHDKSALAPRRELLVAPAADLHRAPPASSTKVPATGRAATATAISTPTPPHAESQKDKWAAQFEAMFNDTLAALRAERQAAVNSQGTSSSAIISSQSPPQVPASTLEDSQSVSIQTVLASTPTAATSFTTEPAAGASASTAPGISLPAPTYAASVSCDIDIIARTPTTCSMVGLTSDNPADPTANPAKCAEHRDAEEVRIHEILCKVSPYANPTLKPPWPSFGCFYGELYQQGADILPTVDGMATASILSLFPWNPSGYLPENRPKLFIVPIAARGGSTIHARAIRFQNSTIKTCLLSLWAWDPGKSAVDGYKCIIGFDPIALLYPPTSTTCYIQLLFRSSCATSWLNCFGFLQSGQLQQVLGVPTTTPATNGDFLMDLNSWHSRQFCSLVYMVMRKLHVILHIVPTASDAIIYIVHGLQLLQGTFFWHREMSFRSLVGCSFVVAYETSIACMVESIQLKQWPYWELYILTMALVLAVFLLQPWPPPILHGISLLALSQWPSENSFLCTIEIMKWKIAWVLTLAYFSAEYKHGPTLNRFCILRTILLAQTLNNLQSREPPVTTTAPGYTQWEIAWLSVEFKGDTLSLLAAEFLEVCSLHFPWEIAWFLVGLPCGCSDFGGSGHYTVMRWIIAWIFSLVLLEILLESGVQSCTTYSWEFLLVQLKLGPSWKLFLHTVVLMRANGNSMMMLWHTGHAAFMVFSPMSYRVDIYALTWEQLGSPMVQAAQFYPRHGSSKNFAVPIVDQKMLTRGHDIKCALEIMQWKIAWSLNLLYSGGNKSRQPLSTLILVHEASQQQRSAATLQYFTAIQRPWDPAV